MGEPAELTADDRTYVGDVANHVTGSPVREEEPTRALADFAGAHRMDVGWTLLAMAQEILRLKKFEPSADEIESLREIAGYFDTDDHCPNCGELFPDERGGTCKGNDERCGYFVTPKRIGVQYIDRIVEASK